MKNFFHSVFPKKRTLKRLSLKTINVFVLLTFLLQPVGTPGFHSSAVALAQETEEASEEVIEEDEEKEVSDEVDEVDEEEESDTEDGNEEDEESDDATEEEDDATDESSDAQDDESDGDSESTEEQTGSSDGSEDDTTEEDSSEGDTDTEDGNEEDEEGVITDEAASTEVDEDGDVISDTETNIRREEVKDVIKENAEEVEEAEDDNTEAEVICDDEWKKNKDGSYTRCVEEGEEYELDFNKDDERDGLTIIFTKIDEEANADNAREITIKEVELTKEQIKKLRALTDTAWDITSTMENDTFEYELTFPSLGQSIDEDLVEVIIVDEVEDLDNEEKWEKAKSKNIDVDEDDGKITEIGNHFSTHILVAAPVVNVANVEVGGCLGDQGVGKLNCSANDVPIIVIDDVEFVNGDTCDFPGDTATVYLKAQVDPNASNRYDVGFWMSLDGGDPEGSGSCAAVALPTSPAPFQDNDFDQCGDVSSGQPIPPGTTINPDDPIEIPCTDTDGDGFIDIQTIVVWDNQANNVCTSPTDIIPNNPSKCERLPTFQIPVPVPGQIIVEKVTDPTGTTDSFDFNLTGEGEDEDFPLTDGQDWESGVDGPQLFDGTYTIIEEAIATGWTLDDVSCESTGGAGGSTFGDAADGQVVTLVSGDIVTCTFTNVAQEALLTLTKVVINDNGGSAVPDDFNLTVGGVGVLSGVTNTYPVGQPLAINETVLDGYSFVDITGDAKCPAVLGGTLTLDINDDITCTITNDDDTASLTLVKVVTNDNGGSAVVTDFPLTASANSFTSGVAQDVDAGSYDLAETNVDGYTASDWVCVGGSQVDGDTVTLSSGQSATCTITNDDDPATLTLIKELTQDHGGTDLATAWTLSANGLTSISGVTGAAAVTNALVSAGTYTLSESGPTPYTAGDWACVGGTQVDDMITVANGQSATCTIINDDIAPQLTVIKIVDNTTGGVLSSSDFTMNVSGTDVSNASFPGSDTGVTVELDAGAYSVSEDEAFATANGYAFTYSTDCVSTIAIGESKTCTVTNAAIAPTLTVIKQVTNDNGGALSATDFDLFIDAIPVDSGDTTTLASNVQYIVSETQIDGYTFDGITGDCAADGSITLSPGQSATCTLLNNDIAPTLTLEKTVVNDNGGAATETDFQGQVDGGNVEWDVANAVSAGAHNATETVLAGGDGYTAGSWGGDCAADGSITLSPGQDATCTITNDDDTASLTLVKVVTNDNGGSAVVTDFPLTANGDSFTSGVAQDVDAGSYDLAETGVTGYTASDWVCVGGSQDDGDTVTLDSGESATCTITNDDDTASLTLVKVVTNDNGGSAVVTDFPLTANGDSFTSGVAQDVDAGSYDLAETGVTGYTASDWACVGGSQDDADTVTLDSGESATCTITNDDTAPTVTVIKVTDPAESEQDFTFTLDNNNGQNVIPFTLDTDTVDATVDNTSVSSDLSAGTVTITEDALVGWDLDSVQCIDSATQQAVVAVVTEDSIGFSLALDQDIVCTFTNVQRGAVIVTKFHDVNGDGVFDADEVTLPGWDMNLTTGVLPTVTQTTDVDGTTTFATVDPSGQHVLSETQQDGWLQTALYCTQEQEELQDDDQKTINQAVELESLAVVAAVVETVDVVVAAGQTTECFVGNQFIEPNLTVAKTNNEWSNGPDSPGDIVKYTITVTAEEGGGIVKSATVVDLPPENFDYVSGSWTANSSVSGDIKGSIVPEPTYASPGTWSLGDIVPGEVITLTYNTQIGSDVDQGIYPDLALANGQTVIGDSVTASSTGSGFEIADGIVNTQFVGTQIEIAQADVAPAAVEVEVDEDEKKKKKKKTKTETRVLPATGTANIWMILAGGLLVLGLAVLFLGVFMRMRERGSAGRFLQGIRNLTSAFVATIFIGAGMFFVGAFGAQAASGDLVIRAEQPQAASNTTFSFEYVALDVLSRGVSIACLVQKPGSGSFETFRTFSHSDAGNSGDCALDGSVLTAQGTYTVKVRATAGSDTSESTTYTVTFDGDEPQRPRSIEKDERGDCRNEVTFKTANDGQTASVEVYHSRDREFTADASTLFATVTVGPNQERTINDDLAALGQCGKTYWYAVRAFDAAGNPSDVRVEEESFTTTTTTTTTNVVTVTQDGGTTGGGGTGAGDGATDDDGTVAGDSDAGGDDNSADTDSIATDDGVVAGDSERGSEDNAFLAGVKKHWPWAVLAGILALGAFGMKQRGGKEVS